MTDDTDSEARGRVRQTAPQQPYAMREVWIGFAVLAVGVAVAFLLPLVG